MSKTSTVKIYLAPANHYNAYCISGYDEKTQCEKLSGLVQRELEAYEGGSVYAATVLSESRDYTGRPEEAAALGADYYLALHDNAYDGAHCGAQAFYHPDSQRSKALATALAERLNAVCTLPITFPNPVRDGMQAFDGAGYGEIREPYRRGVIPVILEVNFHDYEPSARWLVGTQPQQAKAIAEAAAAALELQKKGETAMTLYRAGDTVRPVRNITVENGKKRGRLFGGGSWTIYEDSYTVRQDSRADGRTVLADENGDTVAAVYADDLERIGAEGTVPEPAPETGAGDTPSAQSFPDVSGSAWYAGAVSALAAQGIINGYPDGTFRPDRPASRAEVAVLLMRVLELKGEE